MLNVTFSYTTQRFDAMIPELYLKRDTEVLQKHPVRARGRD